MSMPPIPSITSNSAAQSGSRQQVNTSFGDFSVGGNKDFTVIAMIGVVGLIAIMLLRGNSAPRKRGKRK